MVSVSPPGALANAGGAMRNERMLASTHMWPSRGTR
jgi:hypothetical protein